MLSFVNFARIAVINIVDDIIIHFWPPEAFGYSMFGLISAKMACQNIIVESIHDFPTEWSTWNKGSHKLYGTSRQNLELSKYVQNLHQEGKH